jgi:hypothetical protein
MANERVEDFLKNLQYECRMVAYCDVLGWRNHIAAAGVDPEKIGALRRQILFVKRTIGSDNRADLRFSSFSDNIIVSGPADEITFAAFQLSLSHHQACSAMLGFLTRGGITVGDICHDKEVVFGPALNRAYELESHVADYPRIVFDNNYFRHSIENKKNPLVSQEDGCILLDPFSVESIDTIALLEPEPKNAVENFDNLGLPTFSNRPASSLETLKSCLAGIKPILRSPLKDKDYERVAWLFDRIARQLGVPLSSSYPREKA